MLMVPANFIIRLMSTHTPSRNKARNKTPLKIAETTQNISNNSFTENTAY